MDKIVFVNVIHKKTFLHPAHNIFVLVNQYPKILNILRR